MMSKEIGSDADHWLVNCVERCFKDFGFKISRPSNLILETYIKTKFCRCVLHVQVLDKINGVSVVVTNVDSVDVKFLDRIYDLVMFINKRLIVGSFEFDVDNMQFLYKQSNIFPNLEDFPGVNALDGFSGEVISMLIESNLSEMEYLSIVLSYFYTLSDVERGDLSISDFVKGVERKMVSEGSVSDSGEKNVKEGSFKSG